MKLHDKALRRFCRKRTFVDQSDAPQKIIASEFICQMEPLDRANLNAQHSFDIQEWLCLQRSIEDDEIVKKAQRMDVDLEDFPKRYTDDEDEPEDWCYDGFGNRYLKPELRRAIQKAMRERASSYRKERREMVDLYIRLILAITGLAGALIGILAIL